MTYSVILPTTGYAGWTFLKRTEDSQKQRLATDAALKRDEDYFRAKIGGIKTAEDLVSDKRLLRVALGAFGLSDDLNSTYFIRKVLEDGTLDNAALANKLSNKQYAALSSAFGFGDYTTPSTQLSDFADKILAKYEQQQFEVAVGAADSSLRITLYAEHELPDLAAKSLSEDGKWYTVLGSEPLRALFETAFGLPASFGTLDIDQQLSVMKQKADARFGDTSLSQFAAPEAQQKLIRDFLLRAELTSGLGSTGTKAAAALQILQAGQSSSASILGILAG